MTPIALTVLFGPPSLIGLLPWQSRETEILCVANLFVYALYFQSFAFVS